MRKRLFTAVLIVIPLLLAGCGTAPPARETPDFVTPSIDFDAARPAREQVKQWLARAQAEKSPAREHYLLQAGELLLREYEDDLVDDLLGRIDPEGLPPELAVQHALLRARVLRNRDRFQDALELLIDPALSEAATEVSHRRQIQLSHMRASLYSLQGMHLASVQERIFIDPLLTPEQQAVNREGIWHSLRYVPTEKLLQHLNSVADKDYLGWLELASIAKDNQGNLDAQIRQMNRWRQRWPNHPAAGELPGGLGSLEQMAAGRPRQVALLLPVTGPLAGYGKAIRDGFLAGWFRTQQRGGSVPLVRAYDTANIDNIGAAYHQAVEDGAELIIGPLTKEAVNALLEQVPQPDVPTLALNRVDGDRFPANFYQFGLAPEDEARQLAEITRSEGYRRPLILAPGSDWGRKVADAFADHWRQLGGELPDRAHFHAEAKDYSDVIRGVLHLEQSQRRADEVQRIIGKKLEFEPRRRKDVDFIFMVARPHEALAIKPLLAFHYAGDLPVYATSHIYSGVPAPDKYRDVDSTRFVHIPWVLTNDSEQRRQILAELPGSRSYQEMYALGIDSFRLYPRLRQLAGLDHGRVYGETGALSLNGQRQITRELLLAEFVNGHAKNIPITDASLDKDIRHDKRSGIPKTPWPASR